MRRLDPAERDRLRAALREAHDASLPSGEGAAGRRGAERWFAALLAGLFLASWHGATVRPLSCPDDSGLAARWGVPTQRAAKSKERSTMQGMAMIAAAGLAVASGASAQNGGYAHFGADSDTIRINGNTIFQGLNATYECFIRIAPGTPLRNVLSEQRDATEDKGLLLGAADFQKTTIRGWNCGSIDATPLPADFAGAWRHVAWVREDAQSRLYIDGALVRSWDSQPTCGTDIADSTMSIGMARYNITCCPSPAYPSFLGDIDWIRVSDGARYSTDFTPPQECDITADDSTRLLLKFNEAPRSGALIDESPNRFACELGIPVYPGVIATSPQLLAHSSDFPSCGPACTSDIDGDGVTDGIDLAIVLARWATDPADYPRADANQDGAVDGADLAAVLSGWGPCP
jgi:hypothetical protein